MIRDVRGCFTFLGIMRSEGECFLPSNAVFCAVPHRVVKKPPLSLFRSERGQGCQVLRRE